MLGFTHLLIEQKGKYFYENEDIRRTHDTLDTINCFSNIGVEYRSVFPIKIKTRPCIIILRRKPGIVPLKIEPVNVESIDDEADDNSDDIENGKNTVDTTEYQVGSDKPEETDEPEVVENPNLNSKEKNENAYDDGDEETLDDNLDTNALNDEEQNIIVENELKKPTIETKRKLRRLIERHYQTKAPKPPLNDRTDVIAANKPSIKSNIKHIIKKEKIKEMIERISQIDLRKVCDLERETTKQCLLKIIDSYMD